MFSAPQLPGLSELAEIGRGGNGTVFRARQDDLGRLVAVKVMGARLDERAALRFAQEGRTLGALSDHPNIVSVYGAGTAPAGEPYLVMQLCAGGSLGDLMMRGERLTVPAVLDLGIRMCGALQTAHDAGILHRDVKPANLLFDGYGVPQLADFGQARFADTHLTRTGDIVATPAYAAPEVIRGQAATAVSDVYSLAATLHAALTGHTPFSEDPEHDNIAALLLRVATVPPADLRPFGVPAPIATVVERAMSKDPAQRPQSANQLAAQLRSAQTLLGLPQTPVIVRDIAANTPVSAPYARSATPQLGPPTAVAVAAPMRRRGVRRWIAVIAALCLAGAGAWVILALNSARNPKNISDPAYLLPAASDYGQGWVQISGNLNPIADAAGDFSPDSPAASGLFKCLKIDASKLTNSRESGVYAMSGKKPFTSSDIPSGDPSSVHYAFGRTLAVVAASAGEATAVVNALAPANFQSCFDEYQGLGESVGHESTTSKAPSSTPVTVTVPKGVQAAAEQVAVPLSQTAAMTSSTSGKVAGNRFVTIVAAATGTSLMITVFQSDEQTGPGAAIQASIDAFVAKATD